MTAVRRLYRATARYADPRLDTTRHFQTKRARNAWVQQRREGYPETGGSHFLEPERPAIPPALRIETADSDPITFPADVPPVRVDGSADGAEGVRPAQPAGGS